MNIYIFISAAFLSGIIFTMITARLYILYRRSRPSKSILDSLTAEQREKTISDFHREIFPTNPDKSHIAILADQVIEIRIKNTMETEQKFCLLDQLAPEIRHNPQIEFVSYRFRVPAPEVPEWEKLKDVFPFDDSLNKIIFDDKMRTQYQQCIFHWDFLYHKSYPIAKLSESFYTVKPKSEVMFLLYVHENRKPL